MTQKYRQLHLKSAKIENMIIITGGAGFIGSAFAWKCNQEGLNNLLIVDALKATSKWKNLIGLNYADYIHKDAFLEKIKKGEFNNTPIKAIIHMGACSSTTETDVDYLMQNNYKYTKTLAKFAMKKGSRFIYASSAATYGNGEYGFSDTQDIFKLRPINPYGYSKQYFDETATRNNWLNKIVGLKFFNVFGPNEYHKENMKSMVCKAYEQIQTHNKISLFKSYKPSYKNGQQQRDFIYIKDCINIIWKLLNTPDVNGLFNVGTGKARTWNDLACTVFNSLNTPPQINYIDMPDEIKNQYQYYTKSDKTALEKKLNETLEIQSLEISVHDYIQNYLLDNSYLSKT